MMTTPSVLIVGAGDGLGRALAEVYRERGFGVYAVTRDTCDLSDPDSVVKLAAELRSAAEPPDLCVFAAGVSEAGFADEVDSDAFRRCFEVNFFAPITLFYAAATATPPCRRFVFVLSGAAELLVPGLSPYALSKRALRDYLDVVRLERSFSRSRVLTVWPGTIATKFNEKTRVHGSYRLPTGSLARSARDVAERIYLAERAGRRALVLSRLPRLAGLVQGIAPTFVGWLLRRHGAFGRHEAR